MAIFEFRQLLFLSLMLFQHSLDSKAKLKVEAAGFDTYHWTGISGSQSERITAHCDQSQVSRAQKQTNQRDLRLA